MSGAGITTTSANGSKTFTQQPRREPNAGKATVLAIGRALPDQVLKQEDMTETFLRTTKTNDPAIKAKLQRLCTTVKTRYLVLNEQLLQENPSFHVHGMSTVMQKLKIAGEALTKMGTTAGERALKEWGCSTDAITHFVYASSSEVRMPGGDLQLAINLGLNHNVHRIKLLMLGCSGGASGMRLAKELAENNPGSRVLLITSETTLAGFRAPHPDRLDELIWIALFGDGAAAMVIGANPLPKVETAFFELSYEVQSFIPGTQEVISSTLSEDGTFYKIGRELPKLLEANIDKFVRMLLSKLPRGTRHSSSSRRRSGSGSDESEDGLQEEQSELTYNDLFWAVHPGGPAVLDAVEKGLNLLPEKLVSSRQILMDYGNIISNSIIYVLDHIRTTNLKHRELAANGAPLAQDPEWGMILSFGPGLTIDGIIARNLI